MSAQKGKDLLLKIDTNGDGNFQTIAGLRSRQIAFNAETVDSTDSESAGRWRELLAGAGLRRASINGAGIFRDSESDELTRATFFNGKIYNWKIIIPDFGHVEGYFQIATLEYSGQHNGEMTFELVLESAGPLTFVAD